MKRNCNLELQLFPAAVSGDRKEDPPAEMTIFYAGKVCVADVTAFQARAILSMASRESEVNDGNTPTSGLLLDLNTPSFEESRSCTVSPIYRSGDGASMKRSLKQFLQKRRNRVQATTPYCR